MAKKKEQKQKNHIHYDFIKRNFKKQKTVQVCDCDAFDMINRGSMCELGSNV